jgi:hypothetical protein
MLDVAHNTGHNMCLLGVGGRGRPLMLNVARNTACNMGHWTWI